MKRQINIASHKRKNFVFWKLSVVFLFFTCAAAVFASTVPIPNGNIDIRVESSGLSTESYYVIKGRSRGFTDSLVPMKVVQGDTEFRYAQFRIVSAQIVNIVFSSDDHRGFTATLNFTPGIYFVGMQYHSPWIGTDYARLWIQKWTGDHFGSKLLEKIIDTDVWGQAHFKTGTTSGILQSFETTKYHTVIQQLSIPNGNVSFNVDGLFPNTPVCHLDLFPWCSTVVRNIDIGGYGNVEIEEGGAGTLQSTPYDKFVITEDSGVLKVNHKRDSDADGIFDTEDNCVLVANAGQENFDDDEQGDTCDTDDDNDGVPDAEDAYPYDPVRSTHDITPLLELIFVPNGDLNEDGCVDRRDLTKLMNVVRGLIPSSPNRHYDINNDGKVNIVDARRLVTLFTNPRGETCE